jgi:NAD(P)-dependent dehydrogenase (short-subunit alcohol dehydrogenase family)
MLNDKVVVVTGGAGLLGRAFVRRIVEQGGVAIAADVDPGAAERAVAELGAGGPGRAEAAALDITDLDSVTSLITRLRDEHGRIDAVVNNAYPRNRNYGRTLEAVTYADFSENLSRHVGGYFLVAQQFGLAFRSQGHGNIVNMGSIYGTMAPRFDVYSGTSMTMPVEYAAIKSGIIHLTRYFAQYFKADGIRVNSLSPGGILDNQPASFVTRYSAHCGTKGMLSSGDIAGALVFLLSDESRFMTGQNLIVDDGFSL